MTTANHLNHGAGPRNLISVASLGPGRSRIADLRRQAAVERSRASRAAALADKYQAQAAAGTDRLRLVYERLTVMHRQLQARHLAAAALHEAFADRMERAVGRRDRSAAPHLMEAVAQTLGVRGAVAALHSQRNPGPVLVTASDPIAEAAYRLEPRTGEGPAIVALASGVPVSVAGPDVPSRWGRYGPAAAGLGIHAVCAVPLQLPSVRLGVLCCYGTEPALMPDIVSAATMIGGALTPMLLRTASTDSLRILMDK